MKFLVATASRHGSTRGIGEAIAAELRAKAFLVDECDIAPVVELDGYDAAVIGSAVYMGKWMPEAKRFIAEHREELAAMPVWLFSSGPLGLDDPKPAGDPADVPDLVLELGARGHRTFAGRLESRELRFKERMVVKAVRAPTGDFRPWDEIRAWAREIAAELDAIAVGGIGRGDHERPAREAASL